MPQKVIYWVVAPTFSSLSVDSLHSEIYFQMFDSENTITSNCVEFYNLLHEVDSGYVF